MQARRRTTPAGVTGGGLPVDLEQRPDRLPGWSRGGAVVTADPHLTRRGHRHAGNPPCTTNVATALPNVSTDSNRVRGRGRPRVRSEVHLGVGVSGSEMGLVVGLVDRRLVVVRRHVDRRDRPAPRPRLRFCRAPSDHRGTEVAAGTGCRPGASRTIHHHGGPGPTGEKNEASMWSFRLPMAGSARPGTPGDRRRGCATGASATRTAVSVQAVRIRSLWGRDLHEIPQLARSCAHRTGKRLVLEQEPQRGGGVGSRGMARRNG